MQNGLPALRRLVRLEGRLAQYVLDNDALLAPQSRAAGSGTFVHGGEVREEFRAEAALRDDLQHARVRVIELNVAEVGAQQRDRGVENILEQRLKLHLREQPRAELVQPVHRRQLAG